MGDPLPTLLPLVIVNLNGEVDKLAQISRLNPDFERVTNLAIQSPTEHILERWLIPPRIHCQRPELHQVIKI